MGLEAASCREAATLRLLRFPRMASGSPTSPTWFRTILTDRRIRRSTIPATSTYGPAPRTGRRPYSNPARHPSEHASARTYPCPFAPGIIAPTQSLAWSANGVVVAYTAYYAPYGLGLYLWDAVNRTSTMAPMGPLNSSISSPSWSPDDVRPSLLGAFGRLFPHLRVELPRPRARDGTRRETIA